MMVRYVDEKRKVHGVESICRVLPIASSIYYEHKSWEANPARMAARRRRDMELCTEIRRVWEENFNVYGARKVWHQLRREGISVARCTVERLMRTLGLQGVVRGKKGPVPTVTNENAASHEDLVNRQFSAQRPNALWVADFTYVATWAGFVLVASVIDVFARMIVGWRVAAPMSTELTLDALEQTQCRGSRRRRRGTERPSAKNSRLAHSCRSVQ